MRVEFFEIAKKEMEEAFEWYESLNSGLGYEFFKEADNSISTISKFPKTWRLVGENTRRCIINKFPYILLYYIKNEIIFITCIAHQHRNPQYFINRII